MTDTDLLASILRQSDMNNFEEFDENFIEDEVKSPSEHEVAMRNPAWRALVEIITYIMASGKPELLEFKNRLGNLPKYSMIGTLVLVIFIYILLQNRHTGNQILDDLLQTQNIEESLTEFLTSEEIINELIIISNMSDAQLYQLFNSEVYDLSINLLLSREGVSENEEIFLGSLGLRLMSDGSFERTYSLNVWASVWERRPNSRVVSSVEFLRQLQEMIAVQGRTTQDGPGSFLKVKVELDRRAFSSQAMENYPELSSLITSLGRQYGFFRSGALSLLTELVPDVRDSVTNKSYEIGYRDDVGTYYSFDLTFNLDTQTGDIINFSITKDRGHGVAPYVVYDSINPEYNNIALPEVIDLLNLLSNLDYSNSITLG